MNRSYCHATRRTIGLLAAAAIVATALLCAVGPGVAGAKMPKRFRAVQVGPTHHSRTYIHATRHYWTPWRMGHATPKPPLKVRWTPHWKGA